MMMMRCKSSLMQEKPKHRKGLWSPEEDQRLRDYVLNYGHGCWSSVPINAGLQRNGKSCRLRWINYLRPGLKRGMFTLHEEDTILNLHRILGNKWSQIANNLPGRTDNEVKNYWHSYLKKKSKSESPLISQDLIPTTQTQNQNQSTTTPVTSLPKILFAEWLTLDDDNNSNNINTPDTFSAFHESSFCDNETNMASHSVLTTPLQDTQVHPLITSTGEGRNFEDITMSGSSSSSSYYMYDQMSLETDLLLDHELVPINYGSPFYSSSGVTSYI